MESSQARDQTKSPAMSSALVGRFLSTAPPEKSSVSFFLMGIYPGVELLGHIVVLFFFFFLRNFHNVFDTGCTNLYSQRCTSVPFSKWSSFDES